MKEAAVDLGVCDMLREGRNIGSLTNLDKAELVALSSKYRRAYVKLKVCLDLRVAYTTTFVHPEAQDAGHITCVNVLIETKAIVEHMLTSTAQHLATHHDTSTRRDQEILAKHRAALNESILRATEEEQRVAVANATAGQMPRRMPMDRRQQQQFRDAVSMSNQDAEKQQHAMVQELALFDEYATMKQTEALICHAYRGIIRMWLDYYFRTCSWFGPGDPLADSMLLGNLYLNAAMGFRCTQSSNDASSSSRTAATAAAAISTVPVANPDVNPDDDVDVDVDMHATLDNDDDVTTTTMTTADSIRFTQIPSRSFAELVHTEVSSSDRVHLDFIMAEMRSFWKTLMQPFPALSKTLPEVAVPFAYYRAYLLFQKQASSGLDAMLNSDTWSRDALSVLHRLIMRVVPPLVARFDCDDGGYTVSMHDFIASNVRMFKLCPDACNMSRERLALILQHKALPTGLLFYDRKHFLPDNVTAHLFPNAAAQSYNAFLELNDSLGAVIQKKSDLSEAARADLLTLRRSTRALLVRDKQAAQTEARMPSVAIMPAARTNKNDNVTSPSSSSSSLPPDIDMAQAVHALLSTAPVAL